MPWPVPPAREIFERMAAILEQDLQSLRPDVDPAAISRAVRSNHGMLSLINRPVALEARELHDHIAWAARQFFIDTAEDEFIEQHAADWQISRRPAAKAVGAALITGDAGANLPAQLELAAPDGQRFITRSAVVISDEGMAETAIEAVVPGISGNLTADTQLVTIDTWPQISSITIAAPGMTGGAEAESLEDLRAAVLRRIRQPPHGGAAFDYEIWLRAKFPVHAVAVLPDWVGRGSVGVAVAMQDGNAGRSPTEAEAAAMLDYLGRPGSSSGVCPVTAYVAVVPAQPRIIDIAVQIKPDTAAVRQAIRDAFAAFIATIGDDNDVFNPSPIGAKLELSRLSEALSAAEGEYAHKIIAPAEDIALGRTEYAAAGEVEFVKPEGASYA